MGQHKHNPTAIAAKEGKLPPKPKKMSQSELRGEIMSGGLNSRLILTCAELRTTSAPSAGKNSKHHQIIVSSMGQK